MQLSDVPLQLPPPTAELLTALTFILAPDVPPLPPSLVSAALLFRHRFLNLTPDDARYFQSSRRTASEDVSEGLEVLRGQGMEGWDLGDWTWKAAPSETGDLNVFAKVLVKPASEQACDVSPGVTIVMSYEPAATALDPGGASSEEKFVWKYTDALPAVLMDEDDLWHSSLSRALAHLPPAYRFDDQSSHQDHHINGASELQQQGEPDGEMDAPEMTPEDFWDGARSDDGAATSSAGGGSFIDDLEASTSKLRLGHHQEQQQQQQKQRQQHQHKPRPPPLPLSSSSSSSQRKLYSSSSRPVSPLSPLSQLQQQHLESFAGGGTSSSNNSLPQRMPTPPSITLSPPVNAADLPMSSQQQQSSLSDSTPASRTLHKINVSPSLTAHALASSNIHPREVRSLKYSLKGVLELWARSPGRSLDEQLSRTQVFEDVVHKVIGDFEKGLQDEE